MLTSSCYTCHRPKADLRAINCTECTTAQREAEQHHAAENPGCAESDILYAGRQALQARAHHAHRNFVSPRDFSVHSGMIPIPPQKGANDGPPAGA